jgi:alpha-tubulin suppressor-like RCC1 family protein
MPETLVRPRRATALVWGYNNSGGLGLGHSARAYKPARAVLPEGTADVQGGGEFTIARTSAGEVWACGGNTYGQLGDGSTKTRLAWARVPLPAGTVVTSVRAGTEHVLALTARGEVYAWGGNRRGQVGSGTSGEQLTPVRVIDGTVTALGAGRGTSAAVTREGRLLTWGRNGSNQTGVGATSDVTAPADTLLPTGIKAAAADAGSLHTVVLTTAGQLLAYGAGPQGKPLPEHVPLDRAWGQVRAVRAGDSFTLALTSRGLLLAWGANGAGQLGLGDQRDRAAPAVVTFPRNAGPVTGLWAGDHSAAAVTLAGEVFTWGETRFGQGGTGSLSQPRLRPARVTLPAGTRAAAVSGGANHVIVTLAHGPAAA